MSSNMIEYFSHWITDIEIHSLKTYFENIPPHDQWYINYYTVRSLLLIVLQKPSNADLLLRCPVLYHGPFHPMRRSLISILYVENTLYQGSKVLISWWKFHFIVTKLICFISAKDSLEIVFVFCIVFCSHLL